MDRQQLPTSDELERLPVAAQVALAARCGRRLQPLFGSVWSEVPEEYINWAETAIESAEQFSGTHIQSNDDLIGSAIESVSLVAKGLIADNSASHEIERQGNANPLAVQRHVLKNTDWHPETLRDAMRGAVYSAGEAAKIADRGVSGFETALCHGIRQDYELLFAEHGRSEDITSPPEFFGPLWPDGAPEGWPEETTSTDAEPALKVEVQTPPGLTVQESKTYNEQFAALFAEMSALHVAMGGNGLRILDDASTAPELVEDESPIDADEPAPATAGGAQ